MRRRQQRLAVEKGGAKALKELRKRLNSRDERVREQARRDALTFPVEPLLELAAQEGQRSDRRLRAQVGAGALGGLWLLALFVTFLGQIAFQVMFPLWNVTLALGLFAFIALMVKMETNHRISDSLSRVITEYDDARFAAPALMFYHCLTMRVDPPPHDDLYQTLLRLLPLVTPADLQTWTPVQKAILRNQYLERWHDVEIMRSVLQMLERAGGTEFLPDARKLASLSVEQTVAQIQPYVSAQDRKELHRAILEAHGADPKLHGQIDPESHTVMYDPRYIQWCREQGKELHQAATLCLTALTERAEQRQQANVLLRAAHNTNTNAAQILLRPHAATTNETPSEQLLRPGSTDKT